MAPLRIYVGSYTEAVYTLQFDPLASEITLLAKTHVGRRPSWVTLHPSDPWLIFTALEEENGQIAVVKYGENAEGEVIARAKSGGRDPCTLLVTEEELIIGNYSSGTLATLPISTSAPYVLTPEPWTLSMPFEKPGPNKIRQASSHPHQAIFNTIPTAEGELLVPDLGADKVWRLRKGGDGRWAIQDHVQCEVGGGPRHVAMFGKTLYTLLELTSSLSVHTFPPSGTRPPRRSIPTLLHPPPSPNCMIAAEILLPTPNTVFPDPYIYVSNRNDPSPGGDTIAIFSLEAGETQPELVTEVRTGLRHLRGMTFGGEDNRWLVAGGAEGGGVKIFERVDGGRDLKEVASLAEDVVPKTTSFVWV